MRVMLHDLATVGIIWVAISLIRQTLSGLRRSLGRAELYPHATPVQQQKDPWQRRGLRPSL
jgi:hypothetical protein